MRLVKITWVDSVGVYSEWGSLDPVEDVDYPCISVGYLVKDGKKIKFIVPHYASASSGLDAEEHGCGGMAIPSRAVIEIVDLIEAPK